MFPDNSNLLEFIKNVLPSLGLAVIICGSLYSSGLSQINYSTQIQPIFDESCTSCHYDGLSESSVNLSSYRDVMNSVGDQYGVNIVVAGEPDNSPLVDKIEPDPEFGARMPQIGSPLTDAEIDTIRQWIAEGAKEETTMAIDNDPERPEILELHGNYPNPFNPSTQIKLTADQKVDIRLKITRINGKLIQTKTLKSAMGSTTIPVSLSNESSGLYLYRVTAYRNSKYMQELVGRMLLIK